MWGRRRRPSSLSFEMECPHRFVDPLSGDEVECNRPITVEWESGEMKQYTPSIWGPCWDAYGCEHVEGKMTLGMEQDIEFTIMEELQARDDDEWDRRGLYRW